jgi:hypothetical protein
MWLHLPLTARLIHHTWISAGHITRSRSRSGEDHHLLWCNFSSETEPPSAFSLYISPGYSDSSHGEWCGFVCLWRFVWSTILGYLPGTSQEIDFAAERIIMCCDATFLLKPNHRWCFRCIYLQDTLIHSMVNAVASSAYEGLFDRPYLDIFRAHHDKSISQQRGSSSAVMQLFFWNRTTVGVFVVSISRILWFEPLWMLWLRPSLPVRLIDHTWISAGHITRNRSRSRVDHHLLWCNFSSETEPPSVFSLYLSPGYSDSSHGECCGFVCLWRFVWSTILDNLLGT